MSQILAAGEVQTYRYWLSYYYGPHQRAGAERITRETPIDSEDALIEEHARLERDLSAPVVLWDWKRID